MNSKTELSLARSPKGLVPQGRLAEQRHAILRFGLRHFRGCALLWLSVKFWATSARRRSGGRMAAVAVMFSLWAAMCALEASPELHRLLHQDAQNPGHNCLVTQFQNHSLLSGFVAAAAPATPRISGLPVSSADFQSRPSYDYRLPPSRAPPAV
jgi:hypothetical protein